MCTYGASIIEYPPDSIKSWFIEDQKSEKKIIWLDIRDDNEVALGVIASEKCRPYHVSWYNEWSKKVKELPRNVQIIIYCRSGARAKLAASALIDSGYDTSLVAIMSGGISAYTGAKTNDSLLIKPWNELPEPSNATTATVKNSPLGRKQYSVKKSSSSGRRTFNLKGQTLATSVLNPHAPIFILEQIGDTKHQRIEGIQQLIQNED